MKFLVDECLSPHLARMARARGYPESTHFVWRGLAGKQDWNLMPVVLAEDWTLVTKNSVDFRRPVDRPGTKGLYAAAAIHAGLVCLNGRTAMDRGLQTELFEVALDELDADPDLVNQVLEIIEDGDGILIRRYALPGD